MKKLIPLFAFLSFGYNASAQLLWKITGNGIDNPSYILGTHHFCTGEFCDSIPGFYDAYASVERVTCEMDMLEVASLAPETSAKISSYMVLPEEVTFSSLFDEKELPRIDSFLKTHLGVGVEYIQNLKPVTVMVNIQNIILRKMLPEITTQSGIDTFVQELARKDGKSVSGLESIDYQMSILYETPLKTQAKEFLEFIGEDDIVEEARVLTEAYKNKDLKRLGRYTKEGLDKERYRKIVKERNCRWVEQMKQSLSEVPTLYAVGAGHLPGKDGVINLLRKAGYNVEPVTTK